MSRAEELLANLSEGESYGPGSGINEEHIVITRDRAVYVPDSLKEIAVQYDHNIETVTFDCPRYWDEHDMSEMKIYVNYVRADGVIGSDICKNVSVDPSDDELMHFEWTISKHATMVHGGLAFIVCIKSHDENSNEKNHWNSKLNKDDLYISEGLECEEIISEVYPSLIESVLSRMQAAESTVLNVKDAVDKLKQDLGDGTFQVSYAVYGNTAGLATCDAVGNVIHETYERKGDVETLKDQLMEGDFVVGKANTAGYAQRAELDYDGNDIRETYETKAHAAETYATNANVSLMYQTKGEALLFEQKLRDGGFTVKSATDAIYAEVARQDANGNSITKTYETKANAEATYVKQSMLKGYVGTIERVVDSTHVILKPGIDLSNVVKNGLAVRFTNPYGFDNDSEFTPEYEYYRVYPTENERELRLNKNLPDFVEVGYMIYAVDLYTHIAGQALCDEYDLKIVDRYMPIMNVRDCAGITADNIPELKYDESWDQWSIPVKSYLIYNYGVGPVYAGDKLIFVHGNGYQIDIPYTVEVESVDDSNNTIKIKEVPSAVNPVMYYLNSDTAIYHDRLATKDEIPLLKPGFDKTYEIINGKVDITGDTYFEINAIYSVCIEWNIAGAAPVVYSGMLSTYTTGNYGLPSSFESRLSRYSIKLPWATDDKRITFYDYNESSELLTGSGYISFKRLDSNK